MLSNLGLTTCISVVHGPSSFHIRTIWFWYLKLCSYYCSNFIWSPWEKTGIEDGMITSLYVMPLPDQASQITNSINEVCQIHKYLDMAWSVSGITYWGYHGILNSCCYSNTVRHNINFDDDIICKIYHLWCKNDMAIEYLIRCESSTSCSNLSQQIWCILGNRKMPGTSVM